MPAGSFLRSRVTADLCGWFICTHDIHTSAVLVIPDIFLIAALFIHKDRICSNSSDTAFVQSWQ